MTGSADEVFFRTMERHMRKCLEENRKLRLTDPAAGGQPQLMQPVTGSMMPTLPSPHHQHMGGCGLE